MNLLKHVLAVMILFAPHYILGRLSKVKSTTHDFAQAITKKLLQQKMNYPISYYVVSAVVTVCRGFRSTLYTVRMKLDLGHTQKSSDTNFTADCFYVCVMNFYPGYPLQFSRWTVINEGPA